MPGVADLRTAALEPASEVRAELPRPAADGLTADGEAALEEEQGDVVGAQREGVVQLDGLGDDEVREAVAEVGVAGRAHRSG